jgi:hypothetical protein
MLFCITMNNKNYHQEQQNLVLVPIQLVDEIKQLLNELKEHKSSQSNSEASLGEFISEKDARNLLGRKTTWFYEQRRSGRLPYSKVGSKVYYKREDLFNLLTNN